VRLEAEYRVEEHLGHRAATQISVVRQHTWTYPWWWSVVKAKKSLLVELLSRAKVTVVGI